MYNTLLKYIAQNQIARIFTYMLSYAFNIDNWQFTAPGIETKEDWRHWYKDKKHLVDAKFMASNIPAMTRRRMSTLSKVAVHTAIELLNSEQVDYLIFASRHGELARSTQLILDILSNEGASPMAFSQSVHNTAAGLTTIVTKQTLPATSIAAGDNTLQQALIEAYAFLQTNSAKKVLLVNFDQPIPSIYNKIPELDYPCFALGLILSAGNTYSITGKNNDSINDLPQYPQALQLAEHLWGGNKSWQITSATTSWSWLR